MSRIAGWVRRKLGRQSQRNRVDESIHGAVFPRLYDSRLEDRRVLSATPMAPVMDLVNLTLDAGAAANDGQADRFELTRQLSSDGRQQLAVAVNHREVWRGEVGQLATLRLQGSHDQDTFVIDPLIALPGGIEIDGFAAPADAANKVVFAASPEHAFAEIRLQTHAVATHVSFTSLSSATASEFRMQSIDVIHDSSQTLVRTLQHLSSDEQWTLGSAPLAATNAVAGSPVLELDFDHGRYWFSAPSQQLTLVTRHSTAEANRVIVQSIDLPQLRHMAIVGDAGDAIHQFGNLVVGDELRLQAGRIEIAGDLSGRAADMWLDAGPDGRLTIGGAIRSLAGEGEIGGSVTLLGAEIELLDSARLDVSGFGGGGQILVGGDYQGANAALYNARTVRLHAGALLRADATHLGDGGRIIVWADEATYIAAAANITARGGSLGGNGGLIETSGKRHLSLHGSVDASASRGQGGTWLIDPTNAEVVAAIPGVPAADTSYLLASDINAALAAGTDVTIQTSGAGAADGDIVLNAPISASPAGSAKLTLIAIRDVVLAQGVTSNYGVGLEISAGRHVSAASGVDLTQLDFIAISAGGNVSLQAIEANAGSQNAAIAIDIQAETINVTELIRSGAGDLRLHATTSTMLAADILTSGGDVLISGGLLLVDGTAVRRIATGGVGPSVATGGAIDLSGLTAIDGSGGAAELELDSAGTQDGGAVSLAEVRADVDGLNRLLINSSGTTDGQVQLSSIRLVASGGLAAVLSVNASDASPQTIAVGGVIDLSSSVLGISGGSVDFGSNLLGPTAAGGGLVILTRNTDITAGADGSDGGNIRLGGVAAIGGDYLDSVMLDATAADTADASGRIIFAGSNAVSVTVAGSSSGNANLVGISLAGLVDVEQGGTLTLRTHPGDVVGLASQAIDLRNASLVTAVALVLDTSGGGVDLPTLAGNVLLGDVGQGVRPSGLIVDTRGTVWGGVVLADADGVATPTVVEVDGSIDLRNTQLQLTEASELRVLGAGHDLLLGEVLTSGAAANLTLESSGNIEVVTLDLSGGELVARVDTGDASPGAQWRSTGMVSAGSLELYGSAAGDDVVRIEGGLTSTVGEVLWSGWDEVHLSSDVLSAGGVTATGISGGVVLGSGADIEAVGSIELSTGVAAVVLQGSAGSVNRLDASGVDSRIALAAVTAVNPQVTLQLASDHSLLLDTVDLLTGTLDMTYSRLASTSAAEVTLSSVVAGELSLSGGGRVSDVVQLAGVLTIGSGGLLIEDIGTLAILADIDVVGDVHVSDVSERIEIAPSVLMSSAGDWNMQMGVNEIVLQGTTRTVSRWQATGDSSSLRLADVRGSLGGDVTLISEGSVYLQTLILEGDGKVSIAVDNGGDTLGARLEAEGLRAARIYVQGGADGDDHAVIGGEIRSLVEDVHFVDWETIQWQGDVTSATQITVERVADYLLLGPDTGLLAEQGNIAIHDQVGAIAFQGGAGTSTSILAPDGSMMLARLTSISGGDSIELRASQDIELHSSQLDGELIVTAADAGGLVGSIQSSGALVANSLVLSAASGIGGVGGLATGTQSISAVNRVSGDINLSNTSLTQTVVSEIETQPGGNVRFDQTGGGGLRILRMSTLADATPTSTEANILVTNHQSGIVIAGTGVSAGGEGSISYVANGGDILLQASSGAAGNTITMQAAGAIVGGGAITASTWMAQAGTGIGGNVPLQTYAQTLAASSVQGAIAISNHSADAVQVVGLATLDGGAVRLQQTGGGTLSVFQASTGANVISGAGDIGLYNDQASLLISGPVVAGGNGSIFIQSADDVLLSPTSRLETQGPAATIQIHAADQFGFAPGAILQAGTLDPATTAVVSELPPQLFALAVSNDLGVNVDAEGFASLQILLGRDTPPFVDRNFGLSIHWGDGQVDRLPNGPLAANTTDPGVGRYDATGLFYQITHQYFLNPDPSDPYASIPVLVSVGVDALGRIRVSDGSGADNLLANSQAVVLEVPRSGLFSLSLQLPQAPSVQTPFTFVRQETIIETKDTLPTAKSVEQVSSSADASTQSVRVYVLRVVTPIDQQGRVRMSEDILLQEQDIIELQRLFDKLGDNRYRIYAILEDGNVLLLRDFYLRNHTPIEIEEPDVAPESGLPSVDGASGPVEGLQPGAGV